MNDAFANEQNVNRLREELLRPLAEKFAFPMSHRNTAAGMPTVLCLGNHSSGKSTFINHLAGQSIQDTGVAPTDDGFTIITYGETDETLDGRAVVINPDLPWRDLQQFGREFYDRLRLKRRPVPALKQLCLIDSPGLIDQAGTSGDRSRGYDFTCAVRWFAETADLVVFFFDPDKPGTTGESLRIFTDSLSDVHFKLLIVFNKVDTFADIRDFARTYGSLCWNLSRVIRTKDMPHIYCTFVPEVAMSAGTAIDLSAFQKSTNELKDEIRRVDQRRRTNLVGSLLDTARQLHIHSRVASSVGRRLASLGQSIFLLGGLSIVAGSLLGWYFRKNTAGIVAAALLLIVGVTAIVAIRWLQRRRLAKLLDNIDGVYRDEFSRELLTGQNNQFVATVWDGVKPKTVHFLGAAGPVGIPFGRRVNRLMHRLEQAVENDIPALLKTKQR